MAEVYQSIARSYNTAHLLVRRLMTFSRGAVLDPFAGSGTVGKVAMERGWPYYLIDISSQYKEVFEGNA